MLIGLIADQGLIPFTSQDDLDAKALAAYREYRRVHYRNFVADVFRPVRDIFVSIKNMVLRRDRYDPAKNNKDVTVRFVGLWDTVAAYGLPVEEWTIGIDRYLWPLELPDRKPWCRIDRACHALSLDDERTTFYPVLWDERGLKPGKVSQVWFSGVHSNVGGGYPDDSLAGVPLQWIMTEAVAAGLKFRSRRANQTRCLLPIQAATKTVAFTIPARDWPATTDTARATSAPSVTTITMTSMLQ